MIIMLMITTTTVAVLTNAAQAEWLLVTPVVYLVRPCHCGIHPVEFCFLCVHIYDHCLVGVYSFCCIRLSQKGTEARIFTVGIVMNRKLVLCEILRFSQRCCPRFLYVTRCRLDFCNLLLCLSRTSSSSSILILSNVLHFLTYLKHLAFFMHETELVGSESNDS